ncbi:HAMP domain-containing sensor histidine kinase [Mobiluncus porci]
MRAPAKMWNSLALTTRLTVLFALSILFALATGGVVTVVSLSTYLTNQQDAQLSAAARVLGPNAANLEDYTQLYKMLPNDYYVYVHYMKNVNRKDREFVTDTTKREAGVPTFDSLPTEEEIPSIATASSLVMPGTTVPSTKEGQNWRILSIMLTQNKEVAGAVTVGLSMAPQKNMLQAVTFTVTISTLIIALVGTLLTNYLVGRAFRPLHQIENVANKIAAGDLTRRIPPAPTTTEVGSLSNSLNVMLSHLEQAFSAVELSERKMRRFVSDASHELRTPTAAIRGYAELSRMGGVGPERQAEVMARIESEATRMGNMVQDLLTLARLDEHRPMVFERTDITALARNSLSDQAVIDPDRPVALLNLENEELEDVFSVYAVVDSEKISQVIANLLSNVRQHTPPGTAIEIAVGYRMWPDETGRNLRVAEASKIPAYQRCAVIEVRDHGPGVDPENAEKVFERFFRADASRVRTTGGTGLGLAIVSGIVSAHNGTVAMLTTPGGGATVRIKVPCQAAHVVAESGNSGKKTKVMPPPPPPPRS